MSDTDFQANPVCEGLEILFEKVLGGTVAAAAVAKQQQRVGLWPGQVSFGSPPLKDAVAGKCTGVVAAAEIDVAAVAFEVIQTVGNDVAVREGRIIVIENANGLCREHMAVAVKIAQQFAFFRVHAENRVERVEVKFLVEGDDLELLVAVFCLVHRHDFEGLATAKMGFVEELVDDAAVHRRAKLGHAIGDGTDG